MPTLLTPDGRWFWSLVLAALLFVPLRRLVFVLSMRRELRIRKDAPPPRQRLLRRRAAITAALLGLFFAAVYVHVLATRLAGPP